MYENLEYLMKELEQALSSFRCWADDNDSCDAAQEATNAFENGKMALKFGVDTEYAKRRILRSLKTLKDYAA